MPETKERINAIEKKIAELEQQLRTRPVLIKTEFKVDEQLITYIRQIADYINNTILPILNCLIQQALNENRSSEEASQVQPLEPPSAEN